MVRIVPIYETPRNPVAEIIASRGLFSGSLIPTV